MNKAHYVAPLSQRYSTDVDVGLFLRTTISRITTSNLWIHTRSAWSEMPDTVNETPAQMFFEAGIAWYERGEYDRAVTEFRAALRVDWRHESALKWIAMAESAAKEAGKTSGAAPYPSALDLSGLSRLTQA
jgi:tetratricopeptide (TPR) repeat protein